MKARFFGYAVISRVLPGVLALSALAACGDRSAPRTREPVVSQVAVDTPSVAPIDLPVGPPQGTPPAEEAASGVPSPGGAPPVPAATSPAASAAAGAPVQQPAAPAAPTTAPSASGVSGDAESILDAAERTYAQLRSMRAEFTQTVEVPLLGGTQRSRGTMYHRAPDRFLMRFAEPAGDIILADGQYVWMYHPGIDPNQVMRATLAAGGQSIDLQREFLSNANQRFQVVKTGTETVAGRQTHALTLTPRSASPYRKVRLWVDTTDNLVRRFEITEQNESVRTLELTDLRPNMTLEDDIFRWSPPAGAQVYDVQ